MERYDSTSNMRWANGLTRVWDENPELLDPYARAFWLGLPNELRDLIEKSDMQLTKEDFRVTDDGFVLCVKSMEEMMRGMKIPKGGVDPSVYDDWYLAGLVEENRAVTYTMIKMREPGDAQGREGSAVPFVSLDIQNVSSAIVNGDSERIRKELHKVTNTDGKSIVHDALKNYFADPKSDGSYLIADCFVEKVANHNFSFDEKNNVYVLKLGYGFEENDKWAQVQLERLSKNKIYNKENNTIQIRDPGNLTADEYKAILTVTTGNIDAYSFAAENQWHAEKLHWPYKKHAIASDAGVGESKWGWVYEGAFKSTGGETYKQQKENHTERESAGHSARSGSI